MKIKEGARVESSKGEHIGSVTRVIIDPRSKEITHVVVGKGVLFREDRVIPAELIRDSDDEELILNDEGDDLEKFPEFEVTDFVMLDERDLPPRDREQVFGTTAPSAYPYPAVGPHHYWGPGSITMSPYYYAQQGYSTVTRQNIPDETVALEKGAAIICEDGEKVGELDEVMVDEQENQATHLVIKRGLLAQEKKLVPVNWIVRVFEEEIHLGVRSETIDKLDSYESD
jgi:sporulation protein YlmC with PRC-barrel domain